MIYMICDKFMMELRFNISLIQNLKNYIMNMLWYVTILTLKKQAEDGLI